MKNSVKEAAERWEQKQMELAVAAMRCQAAMESRARSTERMLKEMDLVIKQARALTAELNEWTDILKNGPGGDI